MAHVLVILCEYTFIYNLTCIVISYKLLSNEPKLVFVEFNNIFFRRV